MAAVNCPFCGKENPEENQLCWFCQALLKPQDPASAGQDDADWLRSLSGQPANGTLPEPTSSPDDWLADLRATREDPDAPLEPGVPDWMNGEPEASQPDENADELIDRLDALRIESASADTRQTTEPPDQGGDDEQPVSIEPDPAGPEEALPDWLLELQSTRGETPEPFPGGSAFSLEATAEPEADAPVFSSDTDEITGETPDWLASLMSDQLASAAPETSETFAFDATVPDAPEPPALPAKPEETPDWLASLMTDQPASAAPETPETTAFETTVPDAPEPPALPAEPEETPDWLASLMTDQPASAAPEASETFAFDATVPDAPEPPALPAEPEETPDWLAGLLSEAPETGAPPEVPTPLWMEPDLVERSEEIGIFTTEAEEPESGGEMPEWLAGLQPNLVGGMIGAESESPPAVDLASQPSEPSPTEHPDIGESQDWLSSLPQATPEAYRPPAETGEEPSEESDIPEWSPGESEFYTPPAESESTPPAGEVFSFEAPELPAPEGDVLPFSGEDLPDWLSHLPAPADTQAQPETLPPAEDEPILPAAIPTWLEAMRPVTGLEPPPLNSGAGDESIQSSGPLAGLRGVLASAAAATQYRKPPAYSSGLQVNERQQQQANLLEDALSSEKQAVTDAEAAHRSSQRWVRVVMGLILITVLVATLLFTPSSAPPASAGDPARVLPFHQVLSNLAPQSPILLAVDYNAGYAGEMRFSAGYVVQELIVRQSRLVWVSTLPTGPILAENLQSAALAELTRRYAQPDLSYLVAGKTANLGYLAGGVTSLQEFASQPQQAARYGLDGGLHGASVWSKPALDGVQQLSDFAAIIVITDDGGVARAWIEQVQPALAGTPMLMIASAQAAPMVIPYLESGQVDAVLAGMGDGMAYERLTSVKARGNNFWRSYQAGIGVIMLFTLVGVVLQALLNAGKRNKTKKKAG